MWYLPRNMPLFLHIINIVSENSSIKCNKGTCIQSDHDTVTNYLYIMIY